MFLLMVMAHPALALSLSLSLYLAVPSGGYERTNDGYDNETHFRYCDVVHRRGERPINAKTVLSE